MTLFGGVKIKYSLIVSANIKLAWCGRYTPNYADVGETFEEQTTKSTRSHQLASELSG